MVFKERIDGVERAAERMARQIEAVAMRFDDDGIGGQFVEIDVRKCLLKGVCLPDVDCRRRGGWFVENWIGIACDFVEIERKFMSRSHFDF